MSLINVFRIEMLHNPELNMGANYWKVMRDVLNKNKAIEYANTCARHYKAAIRVLHLFGKSKEQVHIVTPKSEFLIKYETIEERAKDLLFQEYLEEREDHHTDVPFMKVFEFQNILDTPEGKVSLYDAEVALKKGYH
jgi:hypothetical protein